MGNVFIELIARTRQQLLAQFYFGITKSKVYYILATFLVNNKFPRRVLNSENWKKTATPSTCSGRGRTMQRKSFSRHRTKSTLILLILVRINVVTRQSFTCSRRDCDQNCDQKQSIKACNSKVMLSINR